MRCWKCKQDMPDGIKYCGNCGVRMNRMLHYVEWTFSKKGLPVLLTILALIIGVGAWAIISHLSVPVINFHLDMGWYTPSEENIIYEDEDESFGYVNNMILVFFTKDASEERIAQIVESVEGEVMGIMPGVNQYQIQVATRSQEELEQLRRSLMEYDEVKNAVIDYVTTVEGSAAAAPNDPWSDPYGYNISSDWNESTPDGTNWWIEASHVLSAWEYDSYFSDISVGIVDNGYDTTHEDLEMVILNPDVANSEGHGTHVAGIIGATHNNGVGISGVLNNVTMYCVDCYPTEAQSSQKIAVSSLLAGIDTCFYNGCRVVNMSSGLIYSYAQAYPSGVDRTAREAITYLIMMIDAYDQSFIVVQSAGNGDSNGNGVDSTRYNGYFASITKELVQKVLDEMAADGVKLEKVITADDVMDSIMIVGAVDNERSSSGEYQLTSFSNFGDSITICAPGAYVLSTVPTGNAYEYYYGTSMAAPVVAGITAMVWSVDPDMSATQVQEIIQSTAMEPVAARSYGDYGTYYMINADAAVEKAIGILEASATEPTQESTEAPTEESTEAPTEETTQPTETDPVISNPTEPADPGDADYTFGYAGQTWDIPAWEGSGGYTGFYTDDQMVATVDENGVVTARHTGTTQIHARLAGVKCTWTVSVNTVPFEDAEYYQVLSMLAQMTSYQDSLPTYSADEVLELYDNYDSNQITGSLSNAEVEIIQRSWCDEILISYYKNQTLVYEESYYIIIPGQRSISGYAYSPFIGDDRENEVRMMHWYDEDFFCFPSCNEYDYFDGVISNYEDYQFVFFDANKPGDYIFRVLRIVWHGE